MDQERFDAKLEEMVERMTTAELLATPGVYELLAESLNNEVLQAITEEDADAAAEEEDEP